MPPQPVFPRPRLTVKVHDGNDENGVASDLVNDPVGELVGSAAAGSRGEWRPSLRVLKNSLDGAVHFLGEPGTKPFFLAIVNRRWLRPTRLGQAPETQPPCQGFGLLIASNASPEETVLISPLSNASMRSSASCAHSPSMIGSEGESRLDSRRSASCARAGGGSDNASSTISVLFFDITWRPFTASVL